MGMLTQTSVDMGTNQRAPLAKQWSNVVDGKIYYFSEPFSFFSTSFPAPRP